MEIDLTEWRGEAVTRSRGAEDVDLKLKERAASWKISRRARENEPARVQSPLRRHWQRVTIWQRSIAQLPEALYSDSLLNKGPQMGS